MNQNILLRNTEPRRRVPLCHGVLRNADIGAVLPVTIHVLHVALFLWYGTCGESSPAQLRMISAIMKFGLRTPVLARFYPDSCKVSTQWDEIVDEARRWGGWKIGTMARHVIFHYSFLSNLLFIWRNSSIDFVLATGHESDVEIYKAEILFTRINQNVLCMRITTMFTLFHCSPGVQSL